MLAASILLALVTQLWHVGLIIAVMLSCLALGVWRRDGRLMAAAATALAVFGLALAADWMVLATDALEANRAVFLERAKLDHIDSEIQDFASDHGRYPDSLDEVPRLAGLTDVWGNAYVYCRKLEGFELASLGADGRQGGEGPNADLRFPNQWLPQRLSATRFLFHTPQSGRIVLIAALAAGCGAALWYSAQPRLRRGLVVSAISVLITIGASVVVATFLAIVHIALEQTSGH